MKFVKSINLQTEGQGKRYQKGQTAKDAFKNLHVFQGIGKDGRNVWLLVRVYQHDLGAYRFQKLTAVVRELRAAKRQLRRIVKLDSTFKKDIRKCVKGAFYNQNQQSNGFGNIGR
jgi:hypothetical protein|tara:strand:- start:1106 stop:1450 length:345 start_codon:yes stop_codon:yes gene_type:complete